MYLGVAEIIVGSLPGGGGGGGTCVLNEVMIT